MVHEVTRAVARRPSAFILVASSIVSAIAAIAGLDAWVSFVAAVAALISGGQVIHRDVVVPLRITRITDATAVVRSSTENGGTGTAVQIRSGLWLTSAYLPTDAGYQLLLEGEWRSAQIIHRDEDTGLLLLRCTHRVRQVARALTANMPSQGDPVTVIGWTTGALHSIRIRLDYLAQATTSDRQLVMTGPNPQHGFGGAPAVVPSSGRVCGLVTGFNPGPSAPDYVAPLGEVYVSGLAASPIRTIRRLTPKPG